MANAYTQLYIHLVFSPKNGDALIKKAWKDDLEKYITGIVQRNGHKHHAKLSFKDEYLDVLQKNEIEFDEKYLFKFFGDVIKWD